MTTRYDQAIADVNETFNFYTSMLNERKLDLVKELEKLYSGKQVALSVFGQKVHESSDKIEQIVGFIEKLVQSASTKDVLKFENSLETKLGQLTTALPQLDLASTVQLEFISNFQAIQVGVRNQFGYIKSGSSENTTMSKQPPIARPSMSPPGATPNMSKVFSQLSNSVMWSGRASQNNGVVSTTAAGAGPLVPREATNTSQVPVNLDLQNNYLSTSITPPTLEQTALSLSTSPLEFLETLATSCPVPATGGFNDFVTSLTSSMAQIPNTSSLATPATAAPYPPKAQIRRQKMIYHCKFGEFGILEGQFTEPSGVAVTEDNEIIVADTNNHRIQVFDKDGKFRFQFGEMGKRDGQLLYPNRVAVVAMTGDIVITERSPTHQVLNLFYSDFLI